MNKILIAILTLLVVILVVLGIFVYMNTNQSGNKTPASTGTTSGFPVSGPSGSTSTQQSNTGSTMQISSQSGSQITTKDFVNNGVTAADPQNAGVYYLAGDAGYCLPNGSCPAGASSTEFHIIYNSQDKSFTIALISEPIGQARLDAQQFLMKTLGISQQEMCNLNYQVLTTASVNGGFAGENLGFSFCPGAVKLP